LLHVSKKKTATNKNTRTVANLIKSVRFLVTLPEYVKVKTSPSSRAGLEKLDRDISDKAALK